MKIPAPNPPRVFGQGAAQHRNPTKPSRAHNTREELDAFLTDSEDDAIDDGENNLEDEAGEADDEDDEDDVEDDKASAFPNQVPLQQQHEEIPTANYYTDYTHIPPQHGNTPTQHQYNHPHNGVPTQHHYNEIPTHHQYQYPLSQHQFSNVPPQQQHGNSSTQFSYSGVPYPPQYGYPSTQGQQQNIDHNGPAQYQHGDFLPQEWLNRGEGLHFYNGRYPQPFSTSSANFHTGHTAFPSATASAPPDPNKSSTIPPPETEQTFDVPMSPIASPTGEHVPNDSDDLRPITRRDLKLFAQVISSEFDDALENLTKRFATAANVSEPSSKSKNPDSEPPSDERTYHGKDGTVHRSSEDNKINTDLRAHARLLMGRNDARSPYKPSPSTAVLESFDPERGHCCTAENFIMDFNSTPASPWNTSASKVFAQSFLEKHPNIRLPPSTIAEKFRLHFKYLRAEQMVGEQKATKLSVRRQRERRAGASGLYERRLNASRHYPLEERRQEAYSVVRMLGPNGMSDDESDHESGTGEATYRVLQKPWRARWVTQYLRVLDQLHLRMRYSGVFQASAGMWPHFRTPSLKVDACAVISRLPENFYSVDFLASRNSFQLAELAADASFGSPHTADVLDLARPYNLSNRAVVEGRASGLAS